jgi:serine/threonine protein kinase
VSNPAVQTFGKYQILERIATGGTAEIYKAKLEGSAASSAPSPSSASCPTCRSTATTSRCWWTRPRSRAAVACQHRTDPRPRAGGRDLVHRDGVRRRPGSGRRAPPREPKGLNLPVPHAVFVAIELLKGLDYAHQRQVMRGGKAGPAEHHPPRRQPSERALELPGRGQAHRLRHRARQLKAMETVSGIVKGRFDYMSPEQAEGAKDLDQRSDLFSVGRGAVRDAHRPPPVPRRERARHHRARAHRQVRRGVHSATPRSRSPCRPSSTARCRSIATTATRRRARSRKRSIGSSTTRASSSRTPRSPRT